MDGIIDLSWRAYPAAALMAVGFVVTACSVHRAVANARRERRDPMRALVMLRGFRVAILGLSVAGIAAAWCWHVSWLLGLSLIIGGEETLESSTIIAALRWGGSAGQPDALRTG